MKKGSLLLAIAVGFVVLGIGCPGAQAGFVPLPTSLDTLLPTGSFTVVVGAETLTFSNFTYNSSSTPPPGSPGPPASGISVSPFAFGNETGLNFGGPITAVAGLTVNLQIQYLVTAPVGELLNDAVLITAGSNNNGTGSYTVGETLTNPNTFVSFAKMQAGLPGNPGDTITFPGINSILVTKNITLIGGNLGVSVPTVIQGFSSTTIPEPTSVALLGIGMAGFFAFRRLFKRTSVV
jgi:hypothetical protein